MKKQLDQGRQRLPSWYEPRAAFTSPNDKEVKSPPISETTSMLRMDYVTQKIVYVYRKDNTTTQNMNPSTHKKY